MDAKMKKKEMNKLNKGNIDDYIKKITKGKEGNLIHFGAALRADSDKRGIGSEIWESIYNKQPSCYGKEDYHNKMIAKDIKVYKLGLNLEE